MLCGRHAHAKSTTQNKQAVIGSGRQRSDVSIIDVIKAQLQLFFGEGLGFGPGQYHGEIDAEVPGKQRRNLCRQA